jgi:manganese/zinc/iron transport system permease protein
LDQDCVLHGEIAYVPLDLWISDSGTIYGPRVLYVSGIVLVLVLGFIVFGYKELYLTTFDPAFASAIGISTIAWYYLLMGAVSLTTVASFESVGAILVVALLIAPPATAYLLTENFSMMLVLTSFIGILVSILGYYLAAWVDGSIAGAMSTVSGGLFLLTFVLSPKEGLLIKYLRYR